MSCRTPAETTIEEESDVTPDVHPIAKGKHQRFSLARGLPVAPLCIGFQNAFDLALKTV